MLPMGKHVRGVYLEGDSALVKLPRLSSPKLFLECSTIDVATSKEVGDAILASGIGYFADAPVSVSLHCTAWINSETAS